MHHPSLTRITINLLAGACTKHRQLETSLTGVMKQIKVNTLPGKVLVVYWNWLTIMSSCILQEISRVVEQRRQLIKQMEPLAAENEKLKEARNLSEKNI